MSGQSGGVKAVIDAIYLTAQQPPTVTAHAGAISQSLNVAVSQACATTTPSDTGINPSSVSIDGYLLVEVTLPSILFSLANLPPTPHEMTVWLKATAFDSQGMVTTFEGHGYCAAVIDLVGPNGQYAAVDPRFEAGNFGSFIDLTFEATP